MALVAQLQLLEAGRPARIVAVRSTVTIGRDIDNDVVLAARSVSRYHAVLVYDTREARLVDLGSTNGTLVNGVALQPDEPVHLSHGDLLQFGEASVCFVEVVRAGQTDRAIVPIATASPAARQVMPAMQHDTRRKF